MPKATKKTRDANRLKIESADVTLCKPAEGTGPRRFKMLAYTGADIARWYGRATFDIDGIEAPSRVPILLNHDDDDAESVVGYADSVKKTKLGLELEGVLTDATRAGRLVAKLSDEGYPWTASVGLVTATREEVDAGATARVNGREVAGPHTIHRKTRLFETSFVTAGPADANTHAEALTAEAEEQTMDPKEFASAHPEAVKTWQRESREALVGELREVLAKFPEREAWATKLYLDGKSLVEIKASLADVLQDELKAERERAGKALEDAKTLSKLKADANHPGAGFNAPGREAGKVEDLADGASLEERGKALFKKSARLRAEFAGSESALLAYMRREADEGAALLAEFKV